VRTLAERSVDVKKIIALVSWAALSACLNAQITLGTTVGTFGVLAGFEVTNSGGTVVSGTGGNVGVSPSTTITGLPSGSVSGTIYAGGPVAATAQSELTAAYNAASAVAFTHTPTEDVGGQTLLPGVYKSGSSLEITGVLRLDGGGDTNAQFIFQIPSSLTANSGSSVILQNGASAANVFWLVGSSATILGGVPFYGNIMAYASISFGTGASLQGRALAETGTVTLLDNAITVPASLGGPGAPATPPVPPVTPVPGSTPLPSSLILVATALGCAGIYQARRRLLALFGRN
jgi:hypothetical protein